MKQSTRSYTGFLLFVLLIASTFSCGNCLLEPIFRKYHVQIVNELEGGKVLDVHCKSKDDDLGQKTLAPNGGHFEFGFHVNAFATTLFTCDLWFDQDFHAGFKAFEPTNTFVDDDCGGSWCVWTAKNGGVYLNHRETHAVTITVPWGP